jgi:predicted DNA-binding transcriptional regulator AlpA
MTLLTAAEAARALRLSERTLDRLRVDGLGPQFIKMKRRILYSESALQEWLARRTVRSTSEYFDCPLRAGLFDK